MNDSVNNACEHTPIVLRRRFASRRQRFYTPFSVFFSVIALGRSLGLVAPRRVLQLLIAKASRMCFTNFFILSLRGDTIISRDCTNQMSDAKSFLLILLALDRGDIAKGSPEAFFRHVKTMKTEAHPIFVRRLAQSQPLALTPSSAY